MSTWDLRIRLSLKTESWLLSLVKMRSDWSRVDPNPISGVLTDRHTGRRPGDHGGRGWNDVSTGQGTPRIASNIRSQKEAKKDNPPELLEGG